MRLDCLSTKLFSYMQMSKLNFSLCIKHFTVVYKHIFILKIVGYSINNTFLYKECSQISNLTER